VTWPGACRSNSTARAHQHHGLVADGELSTQHPSSAGPSSSPPASPPWVGIYVIRAKSSHPTLRGAPAAVVAAQPRAGAANAARIVERHVEERTGPKLDEAAVVAPWAGLGSADNYPLIEEVAKLLNGAAGASRPSSTPGGSPTHTRWARPARRSSRRLPASHLGRDPAPGRHEGIEEHRRGQQGPGRPIFGVADLGIVGDVHKVLPPSSTRSRTGAERPGSAPAVAN